MLEVRNLSKIYKSKERNEVQALEDINLTFNNQGLVFVIGPSGCGKSTLLNIIGGIDIPTSGEVLVDEKNIGTTEKALDEYRNRYIGFVFQEFNLINDMTVYDNLSLVCCEEEKIKNVLKKVGLEGYEKRYPTELSGGQVQRVTIARALLKESRFLLADEPTGNLNNKMSVEIFELLKEISKEKLVIVVSHNEVLSRKYGDRIISIQDGEIIEDNQKELIKEEKEYIDETKVKKITNKTLLKLVRKNIIGNIRDFIITSIILLLCFSCISISFSIISYDRVDVDIKNLKRINEIEYLYMYEKEYNLGPPTISQINRITTKFKNLTYMKNGKVKDETIISKMGLKFLKKCDRLKTDNIYIFESYIKQAIYSEILYHDKMCTKLVSESEAENLDVVLNSYLKVNFFPNSIDHFESFKIDGVIENLIDDKITYSEENTDKLLEQEFLENFQIDNCVLYLENSLYDKAIRKTEIGISAYNNGDQIYSTVNEQLYEGNVLYISNEYDCIENEITNFIVTDTKLIECKDINDVKNTIGENEVYISLELYNKLFFENKRFEYFINKKLSGKYEIKNFPNNIGDTISIELIENKFRDYDLVFDNLVIKGIILNESSLLKYQVIVNDKIYGEMYDFIQVPKLYISKSSIDDLRSFVEYADKINMKPYYVCSDNIDEHELFIYDWQYTFSIIFILLTIAFVFIECGFISRFIRKKKKETGIFKSIGISNDNISKIYMWYVAVCTAILIIVTIISSNFSLMYVNNLLIAEGYSLAKVLYYKWWYTIMIISFNIIINFTLSFIILHKFKNKRAIKLIKVVD